MDELKKEMEEKYRRDLALKIQEFEQHLMFTKQAADEERARLMIENPTLSDVRNKELRV